MGTLVLFFVICFNFCSVEAGLAQGYGTPYTTILTNNISATDVTISVQSTVGFALSDFIWIDNERMSYTGTDITDFTGVTRAVADQNGLGVVATAHSTGAQVYTEGMNALNAMLGFNYQALQLSYGTPITFILAISAYIGSIPRFIWWNVGFMSGSGWSLFKIIFLYPLSAAFIIAFIFFLVQLLWMLKPNVL